MNQITDYPHIYPTNVYIYTCHDKIVTITQESRKLNACLINEYRHIVTLQEKVIAVTSWQSIEGNPLDIVKDFARDNGYKITDLGQLRPIKKGE